MTVALEEVIGRHPKVLEVGVIGRESEKWGESPVAVHFIDQLPRNPSGKILRRLLREQFN